MTLSKFIAQAATGDAWIVDAAGNIHSTSWLAYCELPPSALRGCLVFTRPGSAVKCAAQIWRKRQQAWS
jgi:hypothetical protein